MNKLLENWFKNTSRKFIEKYKYDMWKDSWCLGHEVISTKMANIGDLCKGVETWLAMHNADCILNWSGQFVRICI